jgi:hypothetical protein
MSHGRDKHGSRMHGQAHAVSPTFAVAIWNVSIAADTIETLRHLQVPP